MVIIGFLNFIWIFDYDLISDTINSDLIESNKTVFTVINSELNILNLPIELAFYNPFRQYHSIFRGTYSVIYKKKKHSKEYSRRYIFIELNTWTRIEEDSSKPNKTLLFEDIYGGNIIFLEDGIGPTINLVHEKW